MPIDLKQLKDLCQQGMITDDFASVAGAYYDELSAAELRQYLANQLTDLLTFEGSIVTKQELLSSIYARLKGKGLAVLQLALTVLLSNNITEFPADVCTSCITLAHQESGEQQLYLTDDAMSVYNDLLAKIVKAFRFEHVTAVVLNPAQVAGDSEAYLSAIADAVGGHVAQFPVLHEIIFKYFSIDFDVSKLLKSYGFTSVSFEELWMNEDPALSAERIQHILKLVCPTLESLTIALSRDEADNSAIARVLRVLQELELSKLHSLILYLVPNSALPYSQQFIIEQQRIAVEISQLCLPNAACPHLQWLEVNGETCFSIECWGLVLANVSRLTLSAINAKQLWALVEAVQFSAINQYTLALDTIVLTPKYEQNWCANLVCLIGELNFHAINLRVMHIILPREATAEECYQCLSAFVNAGRLKGFYLHAPEVLREKTNEITYLTLLRNRILLEQTEPSVTMQKYQYIQALIEKKLQGFLPVTLGLTDENRGSVQRAFVQQEQSAQPQGPGFW